MREAILRNFWHLVRRVKPVRERVTLGERNDHVEREHVARYRFAQRFCEGKTVADIACGTGYGSELLREVAISVDGYDRESLCGNHVIDLDSMRWDKRYDVIVSFETIEHLKNPAFFLDNVASTAGLLIVSTPIGETRGYNPFHHQVWSLPEFVHLIESRFSCEIYHQHDDVVTEKPVGKTRFVIAVCRPHTRASRLSTEDNG